jgi:hypothetical protein
MSGKSARLVGYYGTFPRRGHPRRPGQWCATPGAWGCVATGGDAPGRPRLIGRRRRRYRRPHRGIYAAYCIADLLGRRRAIDSY